MRILIIGSKGFIGKHCVNHFKQNTNIELHGCDVMVDYVENNYHLIDTSNSDYNKIFQAFNFDVCINCSGAASVPDSIQNPSRDYQLNTVNVFKILDAIRQYAPLCKFINLSSAAVYGNPISLPIIESQKIAPVSPYGYNKWQSEIICQGMTEQFGLKTASLRIFSAYGEGLYKQLFWDLFQKSKSGEPIELYGTGEESRDFIHVKDIIQIIEIAMNRLDFKANILNIANGVEVKIKDAVATFYDVLNITTPYRFMGQVRRGDPSNWVADISYIQQLGYQQQILLREGLQAYGRWVKELE